MRVLVACEFSGIVRDAFRAQGHDAWSCDLEATERPGPHIQADLNLVLNYPDRVLGGMPRWMRSGEWDLGIFHPPCTFLANSGVRWLYGGKMGGPLPEQWRLRDGRVVDAARWERMDEAAAFFAMCLNASIPRIAVENPIMHRYGRQEIIARTFDETDIEVQTIQPWQFGTPETKATQLWLRNLPALVPTNIVDGRTPRVHFASPGPDRWKERSRTDPNIAAAMAKQWGRVG